MEMSISDLGQARILFSVKATKNEHSRETGIMNDELKSTGYF